MRTRPENRVISNGLGQATALAAQAGPTFSGISFLNNLMLQPHNCLCVAFDRAGRRARRLLAVGALALICVPALAAAATQDAAQEAEQQSGQQTGQPADTSGRGDADRASAAAAVPEPIRRDLSFTLPQGQPILVENPFGSVYLRFGGYEHQLDIRATIQQPTGAAEFSFAPVAVDGSFRVVPALPQGAMLATAQRIDLVLYVPEKHALRVRTDAGVIEARGLKSDVVLNSNSGSITLRGIEGLVQAESGSGRIEAALGDNPSDGAYQRIATRTGDITVGMGDGFNSEVQLASSGVFATEFSLQVTHRDGEEPNKRAVSVVGKPKPGKQKAVLVLESLRGEIRMYRRAVFVEPQ